MKTFWVDTGSERMCFNVQISNETINIKVSRIYNPFRNCHQTFYINAVIPNILGKPARIRIWIKRSGEKTRIFMRAGKKQIKIMPVNDLPLIILKEGKKEYVFWAIEKGMKSRHQWGTIAYHDDPAYGNKPHSWQAAFRKPNAA